MEFSTKIFLFFILANLLVLGASSLHNYNDFFECLTFQCQNLNSTTSDLIYTPNNPLYSSLMQTQNLRPASMARQRPLIIITPHQVSQIQAAIYCSKKHELQMRVRSGGHDYEGLSYVSENPFFVVDLRNFDSVSIDVEDDTAWVEAGATLGKLYYTINAEKNKTLGYTAGVCPTVGVGGHFSGGGYGMMSRRHGLAMHRSVSISPTNRSRTIQASFTSLFLGRASDLLPIMQEKFPELGLVEQDCIEMSWIESVLFFAGFGNEYSRDILLSRIARDRVYYKGKSDYVKQPIPENGLKGIWEFLNKEDENQAEIQFSPYGGRLNEFAESETPFPHRSGNLYMILYWTSWIESGTTELERHLTWIQRLYTPYALQRLYSYSYSYISEILT